MSKVKATAEINESPQPVIKSKLPFGFEAKDGYTCIIVKERQLVVLTSDKIVCECRYEAEDGTFADAMFRFSGRTEGTLRLSALQLSDPMEFKKALLTGFVYDNPTTSKLTTIITQTDDNKLIVRTMNTLINYMVGLYEDCHLYTSLRPGIGDVTTLADRSDISEKLMEVKDFSIWNGGNEVLMTYWKDGKYEHKQAPFDKCINEFQHKQFQLTNSSNQLSAGFGTYPEELEKGIANLIKYYQFTGGMMAAWSICASYYKDLMASEINIPPIYLYGDTQDGKSWAARTIHAMFGLYSSYASQVFKGNGVSGVTKVYIDRLFGGNDGIHSIPAILDEGEKKDEKANASEIQKMILAIYDGAGRGQGTKSQSGTYKTVYATTAIIAGIDLPEQSEALNRCFIINMKKVSKEFNTEYERTFKKDLKPLSSFILTARKSISYKHLIKRFYDIRESVFEEMQELGMTNRETSSIALIKAGYELLVENNMIPKDTVLDSAWYDQIDTINKRAKDIDITEQLLRMAMDVAGMKLGFIEWGEYITYQDFSCYPTPTEPNTKPYYRLIIKTSKEGDSRLSFKLLAEYYRQETQKPMDAVKAYQALLSHRFLVKNNKGDDTYSCIFWNVNTIIIDPDMKKRLSLVNKEYVTGVTHRCMVFHIPYKAAEEPDNEERDAAEEPDNEERDAAEAPLPAEIADTTQEVAPF
jgi:hypothetical protein